MNRVKMAVIIIVALIIFIVILQNTKPVETKILVFSIVMPRIVLLVISMAVGFALGVLYRTRKEKTIQEK